MMNEQKIWDFFKSKGLNDYASRHKIIYPIAARCGVFAKTDIQPLIIK